MSYILDALKKSEQERGRGSVPDLKTVHAQNDSVPGGGGKRSWWPVAIIIALIIPVGVMIYILLIENGSNKPTMASVNDNTSNSSSAEGNDVNSSSGNNSVNSSSTKSNNSSTAAKPNSTVASRETIKQNNKPKVIFSDTILEVESRGDLDDQEAIPVMEVPNHVRSNIPNIAFEGHVYSSVSERRSVMINGKKMREGDLVASDLILKEITPTGAEFTFQGYRFKLSALQDWSFQ